MLFDFDFDRARFFVMSWQWWCYLSFIADWWKRRRWFLLRLNCTTTTLLSISNVKLYICTCNQSFREKLCSTEHYFCWRPATGSKLHNMMGASINLESIPGVELWTLSQQPRKNILIPCNICANLFRSRNQFWLLTVLCQLSSENQNDLPIAWWGRLCLKVSTFIR